MTDTSEADESDELEWLSKNYTLRIEIITPDRTVFNILRQLSETEVAYARFDALGATFQDMEREIFNAVDKHRKSL